MIIKIVKTLLILIVSILFTIQPSTSSPTENEDLGNQFGKLKSLVDSIMVKNYELESEVKQIKFKLATQDQEIRILKDNISECECTVPSTLPSYAAYHIANSSGNKNEGLSTTKSTPPSSCQEIDFLSFFAGTDGIYLVENQDTNKIEAVYCYRLPNNTMSQILIGNMEIKTRSVHFYAQRNTSFNNLEGGDITFQIERLNIGRAFSLETGIFTAPVAGIYHFEFSGIKANSVDDLRIYIFVNGANAGCALSNSYGSTLTTLTVSLNASWRLKEGDRVNVFKSGPGVLHDSTYNQYTHFTGWLVEEDLLLP